MAVSYCHLSVRLALVLPVEWCEDVKEYQNVVVSPPFLTNAKTLFVYFLVLVVSHGVLSASFNGGVHYLGCVPAGGDGGIGFLPPHGYFVATPERVGVLWGGGCVPLLDPP